MLYDIGDIHGDQERWMSRIEPSLSAGDIVFVNGDFGIGFWDGQTWSEEAFFDHISRMPYQVCFVDGNHENHLKLNDYPTEQWNGGLVHRIRHNLLHLMRGEVYNTGGITLFTFGGGYSADRYRRRENESWWAQEMPSEEEYSRALMNLQRVDNKVDYILTHTAPSETIYYLSETRRLGIKDGLSEELPLNIFLDTVWDQISYKHWYFGHFHVDADVWRNQTAVYQALRELTSGRIVLSPG